MSAEQQHFQAKIDLLDVMQTNPLESEAEAYVLRSIEAREGQQHQQQHATDDRPSLLGTVPDHAQPVFTNSKTNDEADLPPPLRSRAFSTASQQQPTPSFASGGGGGGASRVKRKQAHQQQPPQPTTNATMEETLEKLTGQLHDVHHQEQKRFGLSSVTAQMMARDKARLLVQDPAHLAGSGDRLGQAATVLLRKKYAASAAVRPAESTTTTHSVIHARWGKLRTSVLATAHETGDEIGGRGVTHTDKPGAVHESTTTTTPPVVSDAATSDPTANWRKLRVSIHTSAAAVAAGRAKKNNDAADDENDDGGCGQLVLHNDLEMGRLASDEDAIEDDDDAEQFFDDDEMDDSKHRNRLQRVLGDSLIGDLSVFAKQRQKELRAYIRLVLFALFPGIGLACILFYLAGNTPTGIIDWDASTSDLLYNTKGNLVPLDQASYSWWVLFVGVRQLLSLSLAKLVQAVFIDFFCLNTRIMTRVFGQLVTLLIVSVAGFRILTFLKFLYSMNGKETYRFCQTFSMWTTGSKSWVAFSLYFVVLHQFWSQLWIK